MVENPYFGLFHGQEARRSDLEALSSVAMGDIDNLLKRGELMGQLTLDNDVVYWLPKKTSFSGILPPKIFQPCPAPRWEKDWISFEENHMERPKVLV